MDPNIIVTILGIIIGAIIGLAGSFGLWVYDKNYQERNIANYFYLEMKESQHRINDMAKILINISNAPQQDIIFVRRNIPGTFNQPNFGNSPISDEVFAPSESFYPQYGIFFENKKEISRFDAELAESLYTYYINLFEAENDRLYLKKVRGSSNSFDTNPEILNAKFQDMKSRITTCSKESQKLMELLKKRIDRKRFWFI
jgi:hypothetical protein